PACYPTGLRRKERLGTANREVHKGRSYGHSALRWAARTTFAHFSVSSAMNLPNSVGVIRIGVPPRSAKRCFIRGSARPALISWLSRSTISGGVFLGAPSPYHALAS